MATVLTALPPLSAISSAPLRGADGSTTTGASLWADRPVVVYVLRRPGCILCRCVVLEGEGGRRKGGESGCRGGQCLPSSFPTRAWLTPLSPLFHSATAKRVAALQPALAARGVGLACVANAWIEPEIRAFVDGYFPPSVGPTYLDETKAFFTAVGGGSSPRRGSLTAFLNPFGRVWRNAKAAKESVTEHNMEGDGLTMGGLMVVSGAKGVVYAAYETTFGDAPSDDDILAAAGRAVAA